jgi:ribosome-binding factor A
LTLRYLPEVVFVKDVSGPRADRVLRLLKEIHEKTDGASEDGSS